MKGNILRTILSQCGCAAEEHHDDARTCAQTAALAMAKYFRTVDKNIVTRKTRNVLLSSFWWLKFNG